jgi:hypothetical protein
VIVAESEIHHRADDDLTIDGDRALLDGVHAEDGTLRRVDDRRAEEGTIDATIRDGEDTASEIGQLDFAFLGLGWRER